jgi:hypothetical protein
MVNGLNSDELLISANNILVDGQVEVLHFHFLHDELVHLDALVVEALPVCFVFFVPVVLQIVDVLVNPIQVRELQVG